MRSLRWTCASLCMALAISAAHASKPDLPDWVTQAAAAQVQIPPGEHPKDAVLLEDKLLTVGNDGKIIERYREVIKILRPQGRGYARPVAWFNKEDKLLSFKVWSIGPDGHQYELKKNQIFERGSDEWGILYDDARFESADVPGADPGGVVAYEFTEQIPMHSGNEPWLFQNSVPTVKSVFEIDLPPGWKHLALWRKYTSVAPTEVTPNHFRWEVTNIPGIDLDSTPMAPAAMALAGRMEVYFSANQLPEGPQQASQLWAHIGEWYNQLAAPQSEGPADVAEASRALTSKDADFMQRIRAVAGFMQQKIRYVGIEIGIGGLVPHSAEEIYRNHYGDCKDKATLLIAMLDAVGVRATWVMVDTGRGVVDPNVPSLIGNHMIAAVEIPQDYENPALKAVVTTKTGRRYLIFDPTNEYVPIGLLPTYLQGGTGLLVDGQNSEAITLPVLAPNNDTVDRTASFALGADGSLTGSVTVKRQGASSDDLRRWYAMSSATDQQHSLEDSLRSDFSSFQASGEKIENARKLDQNLILQYRVTAASYAKNAGNMLLVRPRVVGSDALRIPDTPRKYPFEFESTGDWRDDFEVTIPTGYVVEELPDPVNLDAGFASYHSDVKAEGNILRYSREYKVKKLELGADRAGDLRRFEAQIYTDESRDAVLKKADLDKEVFASHPSN